MTTQTQVRSNEEALSVKQPCCVEDTLKLALEALESCYSTGDYDEYQFYDDDLTIPAIAAIKAALEAHKVLAQPEQEPCKMCNGTGEVETGIGMMVCDECHGTTYTTPPQPSAIARKPLTDEQIQYVFRTNSVVIDDGNAQQRSKT